MTQEDCYFYYYSSCNKGDNCLFRHCEAALGIETVCPSWKAGCCFRKNCMYRHMELIKNRSHIPCFWENQPIGCQKPHCVFLHTKPRTNLEAINDVTSNLPGETVDMLVEVVETPSNEQSSSKVSSCEEVSPIASPMVEPVVFNLNEEESDNDSLPSTPAKLCLGRKVGSVYKNNVNRPVVELGESNGDLGIKSLQQIREERARKRAYKETENLDQNFNPDENVRHVILRTEPKILMNSEYEERPLSKRLGIFPKKSDEIKILTLAEIKQRKCLEKEMALPEESSQLEEDNLVDVSKMQSPEWQILKMKDTIATSNEQRRHLPLLNISKPSKEIVEIRARTLEEIHQAVKHHGAEENTEVLACLPKKPRIIKNKVTFDAPPNRQLRTWGGRKNIKSSLPFNQKSFDKDHLEAKRDIKIVENQVFDSQLIKNSNKTDSPLKKERTNNFSTVDESTNLLSKDALNKTFHDEVQSVKRDEIVLYTSAPSTLVRNDEQKTHKVSSQSSFSSLIEDDLDYLLLEEDGCANMDIDTIADSDDVLLEIDKVINS